MAGQGIRGAVADILELYPHFSQQQPIMFFQLKQFEFRECLNLGLSQEALAISSNDLVPIGKSHPELEPALRSTLILLAFPSQTPLPPGVNPLPQHPSSIAGPLYTLLAQKLGLVEPRILKMIKYLCCVHTEWFKQIIIPDRFEKLFKLNELKKSEGQFGESRGNHGANAHPAAAADANAVPQDQQPMDQDNPNDGVDDVSVQTLMEIMGFTRDQAVSLLLENGGDLNEVLQILIG